MGDLKKYFSSKSAPLFFFIVERKTAVKIEGQKQLRSGAALFGATVSEKHDDIVDTTGRIAS